MTTSDKVLSVLRLFTPERPEWTVEAAATALGLTQSTAYDYFRSLTLAELIASTAVGRYVLGPAVVEMDRIARQSDPILVEGSTALEALVRRPPVETVALLCRFYRMKVMCVDQRASVGANFAVSYERGRLMPLCRGAASKVILANVERRKVRRYFDDNIPEVSAAGLGETWNEFRLHLRRIRSRAVCVTRSELDAGRVGLSAVLLRGTGEVLGSMSVVVAEDAYDRSPDIADDLQSRLVHAATELSTRIALHY